MCGMVIIAATVMTIGCQRRGLELKQTSIRGLYEVSLKSLPSGVFVIEEHRDTIRCNRREFTTTDELKAYVEASDKAMFAQGILLRLYNPASTDNDVFSIVSQFCRRQDIDLFSWCPGSTVPVSQWAVWSYVSSMSRRNYRIGEAPERHSG